MGKAIGGGQLGGDNMKRGLRILVADSDLPMLRFLRSNLEVGGYQVVLAIDGVIKEVVETANAGIAVPPGEPKALAEAILTLSENPQRGIAMGKSGYEYVKKHFDRSIQAQNLARIVETLVQRDKV